MADPLNNGQGTGDPRLDAMLRGAPDQTPSSLYPLLHGQRTEDIPLAPQAPQETLLQVLMRKLGALSAPTGASPLAGALMGRDQKMMAARPPAGSYPINMKPKDF